MIWLDCWNNEFQCIYIKHYQESGSSHIKLPTELRSTKRGKSTSNITIKNIFLGVMLSILILWKYIQKELHKKIKNLLMILIMMKLNFLCKKHFSKIEMKNSICINEFSYENKLPYLIYISDQKFGNLVDLLLIINENKSHYAYIKDFDRFIFQKNKE